MSTSYAYILYAAAASVNEHASACSFPFAIIANAGNYIEMQRKHERDDSVVAEKIAYSKSWNVAE